MKKLAIAVAMLITAIGIAVWSGIIFKNEMAALSSSLEGLLDISESATTILSPRKRRKPLPFGMAPQKCCTLWSCTTQ